MRSRGLAAVVIAAAIAGSGSGCASGGSLTAEDEAYGASTAELAVRGFLDAAQMRRYTDMAHLFGTQDGPAEKKFGVDEVEQRMVVLSALLQHASYTLSEPELRVLGPEHQWFVAAMTGTRKGDAEVIIVAAQTKQERWFVEQLDLTSITRDQP